MKEKGLGKGSYYWVPLGEGWIANQLDHGHPSIFVACQHLTLALALARQLCYTAGRNAVAEHKGMYGME